MPPSPKNRNKSGPGEDKASVPLPIQSFLWRQTNPFLGAKVGKLHEASCVTLERVVVQNLLHGLSPSLSDAIASVPRWTVIKAAFPHVIQCCSSLMTELGEPPVGEPEHGRMTTSLAKILYIIHWMLLDSANECNDNDPTAGENDGVNGLSTLVLPLASIQLFVYSLCPLVHNLTEFDISNSIRLEAGLNIWKALWNFRQPDLICLRAPVKPRKSQLVYVPLLRKTMNSAAVDIFMGGPADASGIYLGEPGPVSPPAVVSVGKQITPSTKPHTQASAKNGSGKSNLWPPKNIASVAPHTSPVPEEVPDRPDPDLSHSSDEEEFDATKGVVRSISDYRKEALTKHSQSLKETSVLAHKPVKKAATVAVPTHFEEIEKHLKFVEENGSGVVELSDKAPLVRLHDICSFSIDADSIGQNSMQLANVCGKKYELICERCNYAVYKDGAYVGQCKCVPSARDRRRSSQIIVVPVAVQEETESLDSEERQLSATEGEKSSLLDRISAASPPVSSFSCTSSILGSSPPMSSQFSTANSKQYSQESPVKKESIPSRTSTVYPEPQPEPNHKASIQSSQMDEKVLKLMTEISHKQPTPEKTLSSKLRHSHASVDIGQTIGAVASGVFLGAGKPFDPVKALKGIGEVTPEHIPPIDQIFGADHSQASYFDIAVLRCLFVKNWPEPGVHWGLRYMYNRLIEMSNDLAVRHKRSYRQRSLSMPSAQVRINVVHVESKTDMEMDADKSRPPTTWNDLQPFSISSNNSSFKKNNCKSYRSRVSVDDGTGEEESPSAVGNQRAKVAFFVEDETTESGPESAYKRKQSGSTREENESLLSATTGQKPADRRKSLQTFTKQFFTGSSVKPVESLTEMEKLDTSFSKQGLMRKLSGAKPYCSTAQMPTIKSSTHGLNGTGGYASVPVMPQCEFSPTHSYAMSRSITDSNISYVTEFLAEAVGSTPFLHRNGHLRVWRILEAVVYVLNQPSSLRVCEIALNIIDILIQNDLQSPDDEFGVRMNKKASPDKKNKEQKQPSSPESQKSKAPSETKDESTKRTKKSDVLKLFIDSLIQIFLSLGCTHGCNDSVRSMQADFLRTQARSCFWRVQKKAPKLFVRRLRHFIDTQDLSRSVDLLHGMTGFCHDPSSLPPVHRFRTHSHISTDSRSSRGIHTPEGMAPSYKNSFNCALKGVEGATIQVVLEPLVTKMSNKMKDLHQPENMGLYHDIRCLMSLVQEQHGQPFRLVVLSAMKDTILPLTPPTILNLSASNEDRCRGGAMSPEGQVRNDRPSSLTLPEITLTPDPAAKAVRTVSDTSAGLDSKSTGSTDSDGSSRGSPSTLPVTSIGGKEKDRTSLRRGMFKRNRDRPDDSDIDSNSPGTPRNRLSSEECMASSSSPLLPAGAKKKPGKLHMAFSGLFKSSKSDQPVFSEGDVNDMSDSELNQNSFDEQDLPEPDNISDKGRKQKISFKSVAKGITSLGVAKKDSKAKDDDSEIDPTKLRERGLFDDIVIPQKRLLNLKALKDGVQRFAFALETCKPGTVPDPPLLAAMLTLRSPVLARASLFVELSYFVHRCNKGQWPEWIRLGTMSGRTTGHALGNRGTPSGLRRAHMLQRSAGQTMHQWAEVVGMRLEQILEEEKLNADSLVQLPANESSRRQLRIDDDLEDFLDESVVNNRTGTACPMALRLIACTLLLEITAFLRETFQHLPRVKGPPKEATKGLHPGWERLMSHRRWSVLSNTFNPPSQHSGSVHSITDIAQMLHPSAGERRISFQTDQDESPHSSESALDEIATKDDKKILVSMKGGSQPTVYYPSNRPFTVPKPKRGKMERGVSLDTPCSAFPPIGKLRAKTIYTSGSGGGVGGGSMSPLIEKVQWTSLDTTEVIQQTRSSNTTPYHSTLSTSVDKRRSRVYLDGTKSSSEKVTTSSINKALEGPLKIFAESARRLAQGRPKLLKQGGGAALGSSLQRGSSIRGRRTSIKLKKKSPEGDDEHDMQMRRQSIKSRKESGASEDVESGLVEQLTVTHDPQISHMSSSMHRSSLVDKVHKEPTTAPQQAPSNQDAQAEAEDLQLIKNMPWLKVIVRFANTFNFVCNHQKYCHPYCFERIVRQSHRLMTALRKVHGEEFPLEDVLDRRKAIIESLHDRLHRQHTERRRTSAMPTSRRESAMTRTNFEKTNAKLNEILMEKLESEKKEQKQSKKPSSPEEDEPVPDEPVKIEEEKPILKYIKTQISSPIHCPLSTILKASVILSESQYLDTIPVAWEMMLQSDHHTASSAAAAFIMCSVRQPDAALDVLKKELAGGEPAQRIAAILRFFCLWRNRYHVWLKMEEGAHLLFKVPPPGIDFTLPSPPIGQSSMGVVDPPWMPHHKTKVQELTLKEQEDSSSQTIMTMTKTRRKQKQELVKRAIEQAEEKKCAARQEYQLLATAVPQQAAYEPALFFHQTAQAAAGNESEDEGEGTSAPVARYQVPVAQPLFPSCLLSIVPKLVEMLDDSEVDADGNSVGEIAKRIVWTCLVEDTGLFLRHFLEKLTNREKQEYLMGLLRKIVLQFRNLPSQTAYSLFNYLIGFVMYYVRAPCDGSQFAISMALSLTWMIVPSIRSIYFKDMKQTLKKEQCDHAVMVMANVPSAKKIVVHGPEVGSIPSQFPIMEDTLFHQILTDSLEFFNIPEDQINSYFLVDTKSGILHNPNSYVRDFYFFRRSFYPQLNLVQMNPTEAMTKMKKIAFTMKFVDLGKTLLSCSILKHAPPQLVPQRVFFLHDEFTKLQAFPRKALEACFGMYTDAMGPELKAMDTMHKHAWVQLMSCMFIGMENPFMFGDLHLFINVVNGVMILHCEDVMVLRACMATYINMAHHFDSLFSTHGFLLIMPTILRCYSQRRTNLLLTSVTEFVCKQFYILHRKPFILQMFGSAASILDLNDCETEFDPMLIKGSHLFELISALEELDSMTDKLNILGLVKAELPLKALDLCYKDDPNTFCLLTDALASCVTICATAQESRRCYQMMTIMGALLPHYLRKVQAKTKACGNDQSSLKYELQVYVTLSVAIKALINCQDFLARSFSGPQRSFDVVNIGARGKSLAAESPQFEAHEESVVLPPVVLRHDSRKPPINVPWDNPANNDSMEVQREVFRKPRDALLQVCACYLRVATPRIQELSTKLPTDHSKIPDLLDHKSNMRLSEVALALLKLSPYDSNTMRCEGLQKYFLDILPVTDWSVEHYRSALNVILRRLDKTFTKIGKKGGVRRRANWDALSNWLKGLYNTLSLFPYMAHLHSLKTMMAMCLKIISGDPSLIGGGDESLSSVAHHSAPQTILTPGTPPQNFCSAVLKLTAFMMQALGEQQLNIEYVLSTEMLGWAADRIEAVLCHFLMPMFLRAATTRKDAPVLRRADLQHCISMLLNAIHPATPKQTTLGPATASLATNLIQTTGRQGSVSMAERSHCATVSTPKIVRDSVYQTAFLALRMMIVIFDKQLSTEWPRIARTIKELAVKKAGGASLWNFIDFASGCNSPLGIMLSPLVQHKLIWAKPGSETEAVWQDCVKERRVDLHTCNNTSMQHMAGELKVIRDDLCHRTLDASRTPTLLAEVGSESGSAHSGDRRQSSSSRRASDPRRFSLIASATKTARLSPAYSGGKGAQMISPQESMQSPGIDDSTIVEEGEGEAGTSSAATPSTSAPDDDASHTRFTRHRSTIRIGSGRRWRGRESNSLKVKGRLTRTLNQPDAQQLAQAESLPMQTLLDQSSGHSSRLATFIPKRIRPSLHLARQGQSLDMRTVSPTEPTPPPSSRERVVSFGHVPRRQGAIRERAGSLEPLEVVDTSVDEKTRHTMKPSML